MMRRVLVALAALAPFTAAAEPPVTIDTLSELQANWREKGIAGASAGAMDCTILPSRVIDIAAPIAGVIAQVFVRPGQSVGKGELIARLDMDIAKSELESAELRASGRAGLDLAKSRLEIAASRFRSAEQALEGNVISRLEFETLRGEFLQAQHELKREEEAIAVAAADARRMRVTVEKGEIRAPFPGTIGESILDPGETIGEQPIAKLIVVDPMRVEAFVPLDRIQSLRAGQRFIVRAGDSPPIFETPVLDYISPLADQSSRTVRAYFHLESDRVSPGFSCSLLPSPDVANNQN